MSLLEVIFWFIVAIAIPIIIWGILSRTWEWITDKWWDLKVRRDTPAPTDTEPLEITHPIHDATEGIPYNLAPGTRVEFPNGHYIITRPAGVETNGYGRILNKPHTPLPGFEYTI